MSFCENKSLKYYLTADDAFSVLKEIYRITRHVRHDNTQKLLASYRVPNTNVVLRACCEHIRISTGK